MGPVRYATFPPSRWFPWLGLSTSPPPCADASRRADMDFDQRLHAPFPGLDRDSPSLEELDLHGGGVVASVRQFTPWPWEANPVFRCVVTVPAALQQREVLFDVSLEEEFPRTPLLYFVGEVLQRCDGNCRMLAEGTAHHCERPRLYLCVAGERGNLCPRGDSNVGRIATSAASSQWIIVIPSKARDLHPVFSPT